MAAAAVAGTVSSGDVVVLPAGYYTIRMVASGWLASINRDAPGPRDNAAANPSRVPSPLIET